MNDKLCGGGWGLIIMLREDIKWNYFRVDWLFYLKVMVRILIFVRDGVFSEGLNRGLTWFFLFCKGFILVDVWKIDWGGKEEWVSIEIKIVVKRFL